MVEPTPSPGQGEGTLHITAGGSQSHAASQFVPRKVLGKVPLAELVVSALQWARDPAWGERNLGATGSLISMLARYQLAEW